MNGQHLAENESPVLVPAADVLPAGLRRFYFGWERESMGLRAEDPWLYPSIDLLADGVARRCTSLTALDLSGCVSLSLAGLQRFRTDGIQLRRLGLSYCQQLTDNDFAALISSQPSLTALNVRATSAGDRTLEALARCCGALFVELNASCTQVTDKSVHEVVSSCPALHTLDLCYAAAVTCSPVKAAAELGLKLRMLGVGGFKDFTNGILRVVLEHMAVYMEHLG